MYGPPDHHFWGSKSLFFWSCFGPPNNGSWKNPPKWKTLGAQTTYNALSKYLVVSRGPRTWLRAISRGYFCRRRAGPSRSRGGASGSLAPTHIRRSDIAGHGACTGICWNTFRSCTCTCWSRRSRRAARHIRRRSRVRIRRRAASLAVDRERLP